MKNRLAFSRYALLFVLTLGCAPTMPAQAPAQAPPSPTLEQQVQQLTDALARAQAQIQESQRQVDEMRQQLANLQAQMAAQRGGSATDAAAQTAAAQLQQQVNELREQQTLQETQIATEAQAKVESQSKYPVTISGLLLLNGFVNTHAVDMPATPTVAFLGGGSTGASVQQTMLGLDARGPSLFGAKSFADVRVDFYGQTGGYSGSYGSVGLLRLMTAHATLQWEHTQAFFMQDRAIFNPGTPTSLTAVAVPPLAWSGNLWTWNPQLGVSHDVAAGSRFVRLEAALIDVGDAPRYFPAGDAPVIPPPTTAEQSRWPGVEARVALLGPKLENGARLGVGGYFAPHSTPYGENFDSWAATLDYKLPLFSHLESEGSFYRGLALGGLGGGAYKDYEYYADATAVYFRPLDGIGGWTQLKQKVNEHLQFNEAFGIDEAFAGQLRPYYANAPISPYQNLARNRTLTGNVIYSPSAYLLFSFEYRRLESAPVIGPTADSNIFGLGAGYKF